MTVSVLPFAGAAGSDTIASAEPFAIYDHGENEAWTVFADSALYIKTTDEDTISISVNTATDKVSFNLKRNSNDLTMLRLDADRAEIKAAAKNINFKSYGFWKKMVSELYARIDSFQEVALSDVVEINDPQPTLRSSFNADMHDKIVAHTKQEPHIFDATHKGTWIWNETNVPYGSYTLVIYEYFRDYKIIKAKSLTVKSAVEIFTVATSVASLVSGTCGLYTASTILGSISFILGIVSSSTLVPSNTKIQLYDCTLTYGRRAVINDTGITQFAYCDVRKYLTYPGMEDISPGGLGRATISFENCKTQYVHLYGWADGQGETTTASLYDSRISIAKEAWEIFKYNGLHP